MSRGTWGPWFLIVLLVVVHLLLHVTFGIERGAPDLLTLALLLGARRMNSGPAAALGLGLGVLQDSLSALAFGAASVTYAVLGFLGSRSRDLFVGDSLLFMGLYLFAGKWLNDILYMVLADSVRSGEVLTAVLVDAPIGALYMTGAGLFVMGVYRALGWRI
ncbi:MAG: rod shape-determining protein MreD [Gemmatimonadota bacterium]|jgi:cell shape-determining protein MreD